MRLTNGEGGAGLGREVPSWKWKPCLSYRVPPAASIMGSRLVGAAGEQDYSVVIRTGWSRSCFLQSEYDLLLGVLAKVGLNSPKEIV